MTISRRAFLASASAFSIMEGLASAAADKRIFAPNGGQAADFLICRRLYLDICGRIPTPEEVTEYVNSHDTKKREKLVDTLLESDDFADYYAMRYCDFLRVKSEFPINLWPNAVYVYHHWIRETIRRDMPWNEFARTLLYSRGSNFRVPQVNFLRATARRTPEGLSEAVSTSLLLDPTEKYAYLDDGPADATPEAFMAQLEGPLAKQFFATPVQRVHWWIYGSLAPKSKCERWMNAFRNGGFRLKPLLRHVFAQTEYRQGPGKGGFPARRMDAARAATSGRSRRSPTRSCRPRGSPCWWRTARSPARSSSSSAGPRATRVSWRSATTASRRSSASTSTTPASCGATSAGWWGRPSSRRSPTPTRSRSCTCASSRVRP